MGHAAARNRVPGDFLRATGLAAGRQFSGAPVPGWLVLLLLWWLLFRLMFKSGIVKLSLGDRNWRNLTALDYHYYTQPLPTFIGWYLHQLPKWFQRASVAAVYLNEIALPLLIFGPRECRYLACAGGSLLSDGPDPAVGQLLLLQSPGAGAGSAPAEQQRLAARPAASVHLGSRPAGQRGLTPISALAIGCLSPPAPAYWPRSCC